MSFQIAIDGPAGAGKSTIAKKVATALEILYIDTGAMYRALGLYFTEHGIDPADEAAVVRALPQADVRLAAAGEGTQVLLNGEDVSGRIRTEEAGMAASRVSAYREVRKTLVARQQEIAGDLDVVMDGRDIGTVVLPQADLKIFLTADAHVRALRRKADLELRGEAADLNVIEQDILRRDEQDMHRAASPLRQAEDAVYLDTSSMTIPEVTQRILTLAAERGKTVPA